MSNTHTRSQPAYKVKYTSPVDTSVLGLLRVEDGLDVEGSSAVGEASSDGTYGTYIRSV